MMPIGSNRVQLNRGAPDGKAAGGVPDTLGRPGSGNGSSAVNADAPTSVTVNGTPQWRQTVSPLINHVHHLRQTARPRMPPRGSKGAPPESRQTRATFGPAPGCFLVRPSLGVIVPAFNEAATISRLLTLVLAQPCVQQVVVVDDGSSDGTFEQAQRFSGDPRLAIRRLPVNTGKGASIRMGLEAARTPIVIIRSRAQGKKLAWRDGVRALLTLLRLRCSTRHALFGASDPYHTHRQAELAALRLPGLPDERAA